MQTREQVIKGLEELRVVYLSNQMLHPKDFVNQHDMEVIDDAIALLKSQPPEQFKPDFSDRFIGLSEMAFVNPEPRNMTIEEVKAYLDDEDDDKDPLWVQWASDSVKSGWVLPHTVHDLIWRYEAIYNVHWALWTQKPTEEQRKAVAWNG